MPPSPISPPGPGRPNTQTAALKATAVIGGSTLANIAFGIVRNKAMAVMLGPGGVGLMGMYSSIVDVAQSVAGMGISSSGVRQIAEASGTGDLECVNRTAVVLKRVSIVLGLAGAVVLVLLAEPISRFTFGTDEQTAAVVLLSLAVLFRLIAAGDAALIQGLRRISDLARMNTVAGLVATFISIPLVYLFGRAGVLPSLVAVAAISLATSSYYSRKVGLRRASLTTGAVRREAGAMLKLGFAFMTSACLTMGAAYLIRIIVLRWAGLRGAGEYQAAWVLGGLYVSFILQAMGADFYPRLTAAARDHTECNRLVNEQAHVSLLLAGPGVIATLVLAPVVVATFYSREFDGGVGVLRWICLGMMLRVVAWPMGFVVLAKGAQKIFFWTEVAATLVHVGLAWAFVPRFGAAGAGAAFCALYVWHSCLIYCVVRRMTGFRWSRANFELGLVFLPLTAVVWSALYLLPASSAVVIGIVAAGSTGVYSARKVVGLVPAESIPSSVRWWLVRLRLASRELIVQAGIQ